MDLTKEKQLFHELSPLLLKWIENNKQKIEIVKGKGTPLDYATETDTKAEELIVQEIKKSFLQDSFFGEEKYTEADPTKGRTWLIDPICGSSNFVRGLPMFCTNITLAQDSNLIAAFVVDYSRKESIWSVGEGVYVDDQKVAAQETPGIIIEMDLGVLPRIDDEERKKYLKLVSRIVLETDHTIISSETSLSFAYASLGRIDAYISPGARDVHVAAANFLLGQAGGIYTDLNGQPWTLNSSGIIAARDKELHEELLGFVG